MKKAAICTIGDEILIGQIVDTNSSHIAKHLNLLGIQIVEMRSVADIEDEIIGNLDALLKRYDVVITTGGLGPTKDDITKQALGKLSRSNGNYMHEGQFTVVEKILTARGIELSDINRNQALVPNTAEVIVNKLGTAPCMVFRFPETLYGTKPTLYSLPGVPFETIAMLPEVMEDIRRHYELENISHKNINTYGIAESTLSKMIEPWENALPEHIHLAYLPNAMTGVKLRLSIYGGNKEENMRAIDVEFAKVKPLLGDTVYGEGEDTLPYFIANYLTRHKQTLSVAESCTGGKVASSFTAMAGASAYFLGSVTSYANSVKTGVLGVPAKIIETHGAVSRECAEAMATGVLNLTGSDFSLATTGIAGPDGGTPEKPVGTVWIAVAYKEKNGNIAVKSAMFRSSSNRTVNIDRFTSSAINFLRLTILQSSKL